MNIKTEANIREDWDNVYYDRNSFSIDFQNEDTTLCVYHVTPSAFIRAFRNATCAGCNCAKLQDMDLPKHVKDNLREIHAALNAWINEEAERAMRAELTVTEAPETE